MDTLRELVHPLAQRHMSVIPNCALIYLANTSARPRQFGLFMKDDGLVYIFETKRGQERDLQDPSILFDRALK